MEVAGIKLIYIEIENVILNPNQPRKIFDLKKLNELEQSIEKNGLIQPIIVRKILSNGKYEIIAGERRYRACKNIGFDKIAAICVESNNMRSYELAVIENIQRENLNPIEEAEAYQMLINLYGYTQEAIGERFGKTRSAISNKLRLLKLPYEIKELVKKGALSYGHARTLLSFSNDDDMLAVAHKVIEQGYSVRTLEKLAKKRNATEKPSKKFVQKKMLMTIDEKEYIEKKLTDYFETKVSINQQNTKIGKLEIAFYDYDDLERIVTLLNIEFD